MNATTRTAAITAARSHVGPPPVSGVPQRPTSWRGAVCVTGCAGGSERGTELVPDVREQHDHQDHDGTQDRDRKHRVLEALLVRLKWQELHLPLAASVLDHRKSPTPPGCGGGPVAGVSTCVNPAAAAIRRRFSYMTQATSTATITTMPTQVRIM